jgi:ClpP class serine protease
VTGSIGVASLRPYFTPEFFKLIGVSVEQFFTGSSDTSFLNDLEGNALTRYKRQIDATYSDFIKRVADGRKLTIEQVENVAGGRVMNGKEALKGTLCNVISALFCLSPWPHCLTESFFLLSKSQTNAYFLVLFYIIDYSWTGG